MFTSFSGSGSATTITSDNEIIGSHSCGGTGPGASFNNDPSARGAPVSYGTTDYYALTPAANVMIGIPSTFGAVSTLLGTPITIDCAGGAQDGPNNAPAVNTYTRANYRPRNYNGFPCRFSTTPSSALLGAVMTADVR